MNIFQCNNFNEFLSSAKDKKQREGYKRLPQRFVFLGGGARVKAKAETSPKTDLVSLINIIKNIAIVKSKHRA